MIDTDKMDDLARLYRLIIKVSTGLPCLRNALKGSIARRGKEINQASAGAEVGEGEIDVVGNGDDSSARGKGKGKGTGRPIAGAQTMSLALKWMQDVLDLKDKFDQVWREAFQSDRVLESALNEVCSADGFPRRVTHDLCTQAFESFINLNEKAPEFISLFIDDNLKKGLKGVS